MGKQKEYTDSPIQISKEEKPRKKREEYKLHEQEAPKYVNELLVWGIEWVIDSMTWI